jgi:hypothetical protein
MNSGERIPSRLKRDGVSEQNTKKVLDGMGFLVSLLRGDSIADLQPMFLKKKLIRIFVLPHQTNSTINSFQKIKSTQTVNCDFS